MASGAPPDNAGSYAIQAPAGAVPVDAVEGAYPNVVGLPLADVLAALRKGGILDRGYRQTLWGVESLGHFGGIGRDWTVLGGERLEKRGQQPAEPLLLVKEFVCFTKQPQ
ncbi:MAG: Maf family protein [Deltaproteobacteria bacterium]|nr:Maf family protein [Deltaproteobacteria bacterium]